MRFSYHPLTSVLIAAAVWLSLLPLRPMMQDHSFLIESVAVLGVSAALGAGLAALRVPRGLTLLAQLLAVGAVVVWRGLGIAGTTANPVASLRELTVLGIEAIRTGVPPLEPHPGLIWLLLLLAALLVLVVELLVNGLEQPAWAVAPLALGFGITALVIREDLPWTYVVPVLVGFLMVLASSTGAQGEAVGSASKALAHHASRVGVAAIIGALGLGLALAVTPLLPLGEKQPWAESGADGPIELSDPTVRLEQDLRRPSDRRILTYRTSNDQPVYLRTVALPELSTGGARLLPMRLARFGMGDAYNYPGERLDVDVQMAAVPSEYLPAPFAVDSIDANGNWSYDPDTMAVVASGRDRLQQTVDLEYSVSSTVLNATREQIEAAEAGSAPDPVTTTVPDGLAPEVAQLTASVTSQAQTAGQKALRIQEWLRSSEFTYTLEAPTSMGTDAISSFLVTDRAGYCIHFAASMITMARLEGIPARMAIGFTPGEKLEDGSFEVTSHDSHAWPELFLEGLGWVPFEPTPPMSGPPGYTEPSDQQPSASPSPDPSATPTPSTPASPTPTPAPPSPSPSATPTGTGTPTVDVLPWLLGGLGVLLLLALPALVRLALRSWRLRGSQDPAAMADGAWREVEALFSDYGRDWPSGSPGPASRAAAGSLPETATTALSAIAHTVERSRYARDGAPAEHLRTQLQALRKELSGHAEPGQRIRALALPPSLFRRGL